MVRSIANPFQSHLWSRVDAEVKERLKPYLSTVPVKVAPIADALGLVVKAATLPAGISGEIRPTPGESPSGFTIRVNRHEPKHRQRFTAAHEIAHYLLHRDSIGDGIVDNALYRSKLPSKIETEANKLAAEILMPAPAVRNWLAGTYPNGFSLDSLSVAAEAMEVSQEAASIRLGVS